MQQHTLVRWLNSKPEILPLILVVLEFAVFGLLAPAFLSKGNISNLLTFSTELGMIALAMTMLMIAGEFDLSVGAIFGFAPIVMWTLYNEGVTSLPVGFLIALVLSGLIGFANGWFVTKIAIPSFLVTLGMMMIVRGTALYTTGGFPQRTWNADSPLAGIVAGSFTVLGFRLQTSLLWFVLFILILTYVLTASKVGNWIFAAGGNAESARARGVPVDLTKIWLFVLSGVMAAYAGISSSIRVAAANPNSGTGYELEVIAMVVIGGTALMGGRGTIIGTVLGVFMLRAMRNGIIFLGVPGLAYNIFVGATILAMMVLNSYLDRKRGAGG